MVSGSDHGRRYPHLCVALPMSSRVVRFWRGTGGLLVAGYFLTVGHFLDAGHLRIAGL